MDGFDFGLGVGQTVEPDGKVGAVKELALLGLGRSERSSGAAANGALSERSTAKGTVLLCLGPVGGERVRKGAGGGGRVSTGSVVDGF